MTQNTSGSVWEYGLFILETLVALAVIALAGYLVVRLSQKRIGGAGKNSRMRVVERLPLDHRRFIHLVEVDNRSFLIGTTEHTVQLLTTIDTPEHQTDRREKGAS